MSVTAHTQRPGTRRRPGAMRSGLNVPWSTVLPLALVMAFADGFWMVSMRGAVGSIGRTQGPFVSWLRDSTLTFPLFVLAVLGAVTLAMHLFGPVLLGGRTVLATSLIVVAAGTVVGIAEMAASSAYDYHLQTSQLQLMDSMRSACAGADCLAQEQQATLALQLHAVGYGSAILLLTNLILVGWVVALRGGRLKVSTTRARLGGVRLPRRRSRFDDLVRLVAAGLVGSAVIHFAVIPQHLTGWADLLDPTSAAMFFIVLAGAQLAVAALVLTRPQSTVLQAAAAVCLGPLAMWLFTNTAGLPFGPGPGTDQQVALPVWAACALELSTLTAALILLRGSRRLRQRPPASAHARALSLVAVIAVTTVGLAGSGLPLLDDYRGPEHHTAMSSNQ